MALVLTVSMELGGRAALRDRAEIKWHRTPFASEGGCTVDRAGQVVGNDLDGMEKGFMA